MKCIFPEQSEEQREARGMERDVMFQKKTIPILFLNSSVRRIIFEQDNFKKTVSPKISLKPDEIVRKE